jgi:hypothetical protein
MSLEALRGLGVNCHVTAFGTLIYSPFVEIAVKYLSLLKYHRFKAYFPILKK